MEAESEEQIINMAIYYTPELKMKVKSMITVKEYIELFKAHKK